MLLSSWTTEVVALFYFPYLLLCLCRCQKVSLYIQNCSLSPQYPKSWVGWESFSNALSFRTKVYFNRKQGHKTFSRSVARKIVHLQVCHQTNSISDHLGQKLDVWGTTLISPPSIHPSIYHQLTKGVSQGGSTDLTKHCFQTVVCWRGQVKGESLGTSSPSSQHRAKRV